MKRAITLVFTMTLMLLAKDYTKNEETISFMNELVQKYDFKRDELKKLFSNVKVQNSALSAFRPRVKIQKNTGTDSYFKKTLS